MSNVFVNLIRSGSHYLYSRFVDNQTVHLGKSVSAEEARLIFQINADKPSQTRRGRVGDTSPGGGDWEWSAEGRE